MSCLQDNVLSTGQCLVYKTMSCLQDNVLSTRQCLVYNTMSCQQDNFLSTRQCLAFKTISGFQSIILSNVTCFYALYHRIFFLLSYDVSFALKTTVSTTIQHARFARGLAKRSFESYFVLPKVVCLVSLIQPIQPFLRPAPCPAQ